MAPADGTGAASGVLRLQLRLHGAEYVQPSLQTVNAEFATRYLEQLGVCPRRQTLDLVNKCIPLTAEHISATLRSKGHVNDELQLSVPALAQAFRPSSIIHGPEVLQLGVTNREMQGLSPDEQQETASGSMTSMPQHATAAGSVQPGARFRYMAARYLYPFKLEHNLSYVPLEELVTRTARPPAGSSVAARKRLSDQYTFTAVAEAPQSMHPHQLPLYEVTDGSVSLGSEVAEELLQELVVTPEVVLTLVAQVEAALADWHRHQAPETLKGSLTDGEFRDTMSLLADERRTSFFITLLNFLHQEFVRGSALYASHLELMGEKQAAGAASGRMQAGSAVPSRCTSTTWSLRMSSHRTTGAGGAGMISGMPSGGGAAGGSSGGGGAGTATRMQALEQHDLGYKRWINERAREPAKPQEQEATRATSPSPVDDMPAASGLSQTSTPFKSCMATPSNKQQQQQHPQQQQFGSGGGVESGGGGGPGRTSRRLFVGGVSFARHASATSAGGASPHELSPDPSATAPATLTGGTLGHRASGTTQGGLDDDLDAKARQGGTESALSAGTRRAMAGLATLRAVRGATGEAATGPTHLTPADEAALQQARLAALQLEFAAMFAELRRSRAGLFFQLPVLLATARLLSHLLFTGLYRLWAQTREGRDTVQQMDAAIEQLFDPHGHIQRNLSIMQSSPAAVDVCARHPHKSHEPERLHFADVSPLLMAVMNDGVASSSARKLLYKSATTHALRARRALQPRSGGAPGAPSVLRTQLSPAQRRTLFAEMQAALKSQPPPAKFP